MCSIWWHVFNQKARYFCILAFHASLSAFFFPPKKPKTLIYQSFGFPPHLRLSKWKRKNSRLLYSVQMEKGRLLTHTYTCLPLPLPKCIHASWKNLYTFFINSAVLYMLQFCWSEPKQKNSFHSSAKWKYNICILIEKIAWGGREQEDRKEWRVKGRVEQRLEGRNTFSSCFLDKCLWLETHTTAHLAIKSHLTSKYNWALNLQINGTIMLISKVKVYVIPCLKAITQ